jgi:hypothetical protein
MKERMDNENIGMKQAGSPVFLWKGGELKTVTPSQKEMDWLGGQQLTAEEILGIFGVPPGVAGILRFANYSNMREQKRYMLYNTVFPKLGTIGSVIQEMVVNRWWPGLQWQWNKRAKIAEEVPEDIHDAIKAIKNLFFMGVPFSEAAKLFDLEMDLTDKPWLEEGFMPSTMVPAISLLEDEGEDDPPDPDEEDREDPLMLTMGEAGKLFARARALEEAKKPLEQSYATTYKDFLMELRSEVLANLAQVEEVEPTEEETEAAWNEARCKSASRWSWGVAYKHNHKAIDPNTNLDDILFRVDEKENRLIELSRPEWREGLKAGGQMAISEQGLTISFDVTDPNAIALLTEKAVKIKTLGLIVAPINERVRKQIQEGIKARENLDAVKARVREVFNGERKNALDIARTEMGQTFNGGRFVGMQQAGVPRHRWVTAGDEEVRDSHAANQAHGPVPIGETFPNGLRYPQESSASAEEIVNCRCVAFAAKE